LPDVAPALHAAFPKLELVFREEKTPDVLRQLEAGELDGGLLALDVPLGDLAGLASAEIATDPFVVALPKGHPLARRRVLELADVEGAPVLLLADGHCLRDQALSLCAQVGAREAALRATSLATLVQMVSSGAGVTLLPSLAVDVENRRGQLEI